MERARIARHLIDELGLGLPPIALKRVGEPPAGIPALEERAPSACRMWRLAESQLFYADAQAHLDCPIGAMVMGLPLPDRSREELMDLVGQMVEACYLDEAEVPHIPKFEAPASGVVYGPLAEFPLDPDVVLMWPGAKQAMLLHEMAGNAAWSGQPGASHFGRPGCGALPLAGQGSQPVSSSGCIGMRTFTAIPDDKQLFVVPGSRLEELARALGETVAVNARMEAFYRSRL